MNLAQSTMLPDPWAKGPWRVDGSIYEGYEACVTDGDDRSVCQVRRYIDANMIAAAPELYEALDAIPFPSTMGTAQEHYQRFYDWYRNQAEPAIRKARGETK